MKKILTVLVVSLLFTAPLLAEGGPPPGSGAPKGARPHPPKEAITACEGKKTDDACSFSHNDQQRQGTCFSPQADKPLACRPTQGSQKSPAPR